MRTIFALILGLLLITAGVAQADPAKPTKAQLNAYLHSDSSDSPACMMMIHGMQTIDDDNYSAETNWGFIAASASVCLKKMKQNHESLSAQYPAYFALYTSCSTMSHLHYDSIRACNGVL